MHGRQCAGTGTLLGLRGARAVGTLGPGQDAARREDQDVAVGELLLEFAGQAGWVLVVGLGFGGREREI